MANINGWGRGDWGEGGWGSPLPVEVTGTAGTGAVGSVTVVEGAGVAVSVTGVSGTGSAGSVTTTHCVSNRGRRNRGGRLT